MDVGQKGIETRSQWSRHSETLQRKEELRLVHIAAQCVAHTCVSMGTEGGVEIKGALMEFEQGVQFGEFKNVNAPKRGKKYPLIKREPATRSRFN